MPKMNEVADWLSQCEDYVGSSRLTQWESDFITSIRDQFDRSGSLSPKQIEVLERIYTKLP